jgi:hypothetical protein
MKTRSDLWTWVMALVAAAAMGVPARASTDVAPVLVTYTSGDVIYLDAGEEDGLQPGTVVEVLRAGHSVGTLRVLFVSARSASGSVATGAGAVEVGDQVLFRRRGAAPSAGQESGERKIPPGFVGPTSPVRSPRHSRGWFRDRGIDGRIGIGSMNMVDHGAGSRRTFQQTLDMRITGTNIGGTALCLAIDVRTRQSERIASAESARDRRASVNLLSGSWHPAGGPLELSVGRQTALPLGSLGAFDGLHARLTRGRWQLGAVSATRPAAVTGGFTSDVTEHGLYARFESSRDAKRRLSLGTGAAGSYRRGQIDREFLALQQGYDDPLTSAFLTEEIDVNRGWKRAAGEPVLAVTSFYANVNRRLSSQASLTAGFDNRRNARLIRDRDITYGDFNGAYRDGAWLGANARFRNRFDARGDARWSGLTGRDRNDSYTLSLGVGRLWPWSLDLRSHTTWFQSVGSEGWLHSLDLSLAPTSRARLALRGGTKQDPLVAGGSSLDRYLWYGLDFDFSVGRHWFLLLSAERRRDAGETVEQMLAKMTWRL